MLLLVLTSDVAAGGNHSPALEVLVRLRVHHQHPGLVSACFDEGHDVRVLHGLDVDAVDLERDTGEECFGKLGANGEANSPTVLLIFLPSHSSSHHLVQ